MLPVDSHGGSKTGPLAVQLQKTLAHTLPAFVRAV